MEYQEYDSYQVDISSRPGHYAQYSGTVEVSARDEEEAASRALRKLALTTFPDRTPPHLFWRVKAVRKMR